MSKRKASPVTESPTPEPGSSTSSAPAPAMPLFYRMPEPLSFEAHAALKLRETGYGFARSTNAVPVVGAEFTQAAQVYPLVFAREDGWPLALLGLGAGNAHVDPAGNWTPETYLPAYVRRYPFAFVTSGDRFILAIDREADAVSEVDGEALFENGEPTPVLARALTFCGQFQNAHIQTRAFVDALKVNGLLVDRVADARITDAAPMRLSGFQVVDRQRWQDLPDDTALAFRKAGWDELVVAHLWSLDRFSALMDQEASRRTAPASTPAVTPPDFAAPAH